MLKWRCVLMIKYRAVTTTGSNGLDADYVNPMSFLAIAFIQMHVRTMLLQVIQEYDAFVTRSKVEKDSAKQFAD